jgi:hypothetical protein
MLNDLVAGSVCERRGASMFTRCIASYAVPFIIFVVGPSSGSIAGELTVFSAAATKPALEMIDPGLQR